MTTPTNIKQGTEEWFAARARRVTASEVGGALLSTARQRALRKRIETGDVPPAWHSAATAYGKTCEPRALAAAAQAYGVTLETGQFWEWARNPLFAASPDGLAPEFVVEAKCPFTERVPFAPPFTYVAQVALQCLATGRDRGLLVYWLPYRRPGVPAVTDWDREFNCAIDDRMFIFDILPNKPQWEKALDDLARIVKGEAEPAILERPDCLVTALPRPTIVCLKSPPPYQYVG